MIDYCPKHWEWLLIGFFCICSSWTLYDCSLYKIIKGYASPDFRIFFGSCFYDLLLVGRKSVWMYFSTLQNMNLYQEKILLRRMSDSYNHPFLLEQSLKPHMFDNHYPDNSDYHRVQVYAYATIRPSHSFSPTQGINITSLNFDLFIYFNFPPT